MRCPNSEQLAEYQHEVLVDHEEQAIRRHLADCAVCRRELRALERAVRLLEAMPAPALPEHVWAGVAARLPANRRMAFRRRWWKVLAGAGAAAGMVLGLLILHPKSPALPVAPDSASSYVANHALLSAQDAFADRASIGVMLAAQQGER